MTNVIFQDGIRYEGLEMEFDTGSSEVLLDEEGYEGFTDLLAPVTKLGGMTGILPQVYEKRSQDSITIEIGSGSYALTMESLRSSDIPPGGDEKLIWLSVDEDKDQRSILGAPFFKEHHVYFDEANERVGVPRTE